MTAVTREQVIPAPRDVVFDVIADRERSGEYLPLSTRLDQPGTASRQGIGAVHFLGIGSIGVREQITGLDQNERLTYRVVSGLPVRSHQGVIEFFDDPAGTRVRYTMDSQPKVPLPGFVLRTILNRMIKTMLAGAASAAVDRAS